MFYCRDKYILVFRVPSVLYALFACVHWQLYGCALKSSMCYTGRKGTAHVNQNSREDTCMLSTFTPTASVAISSVNKNINKIVFKETWYIFPLAKKTARSIHVDLYNSSASGILLGACRACSATEQTSNTLKLPKLVYLSSQIGLWRQHSLH